MIDPNKAREAMSDRIRDIGEKTTEVAAKVGGYAAEKGAEGINKSADVAQKVRDGAVSTAESVGGRPNRGPVTALPDVLLPPKLIYRESLQQQIAQVREQIAKMQETLKGMMTPEARQQMNERLQQAMKELEGLMAKLRASERPVIKPLPYPVRPFPIDVRPIEPRPIGPPIQIKPPGEGGKPGNTGGTGGTGGTTPTEGTGNERLDSLVGEIVKTNQNIDDLLADYQKAVENGEDTFVIQTKIQQAMQRRLELITLLSNIQKMEHDAIMAVVNNIR